MNIEFYELVKVIGEEEGTLNKENTEVTYMYEETYDVNLKVKYIEKETEKELSDSVNKTLKRHDSYETEAKKIENYKLVDKTSNYKGKAENQEIEVIYYYEKIKSNITVRYIDQETNKDLISIVNKQVDINSIYTTDKEVINGYEFVKIEGIASGIALDEEIEVIYYYKKKIETIVNPVPSKPKDIRKLAEFIINEKAKVTSINDNKIEIKEEISEEKIVKENNFMIIIIIALLTLIGFIIGKLNKNDNINL